MNKDHPLHLLIVEDNSAIASNVAEHMESRGFILDFATDGQQGLDLALTNYYDVVVLDLMLPKLDGWDVCKLLRKQASRHIPILMLTARDSLPDKIKGFELGADDYLTKPFALQELEMRVLALCKRQQLNQSHLIQVEDVIIDTTSKTVSRDEQAISLQHLPYEILKILAEEHPRVVTRSELCQRLWGDEPTDSDALRSHIYQLRKALDKPFKQPLIATVHGVGFKLEAK
ncbi:response regulator transcription factor [Thalassotalea sp. M1531]|uniref:Response regulator transcription factor n=1 Tax=Thalassotalea algicola TaxID=2716224 RepID=A0A7Y0Q4K6_9GAMM|nr:response regulator transcription factor [Thalassotalea algicola]NMP30064.1 response regulator transcription factor [Thalassotalea algicola]